MDIFKEKDNYETALDCLYDVSVDTIVFAGVEYATHHIIDNEYFSNVSFADVSTFFIVDSIFCFFIAQKVLGWFKIKEQPELLKFVAIKYGIIFGGVILADLLVMHKSKAKMLGSLVNIGLTGLISKKGQNILSEKSVKQK